MAKSVATGHATGVTLSGFAALGGELLVSSGDGATLAEESSCPIVGGVRRTRRYTNAATGLDAVCVREEYDIGVVCVWTELTNRLSSPVTIGRIDSYHCTLPGAGWTLDSFDSAWGKEFTPVSRPIDMSITLESKAGRSTNGAMPIFTVTAANGAVLVGTIAWSGNWVARFEPSEAGLLVAGGLHDWEFEKSLSPGESVRAPEVVFAAAPPGMADDASRRIARFVADYWAAHVPLLDRMPFEWNSWWPYEDKAISEQVFDANVEMAARLGVDICTLDAGWFGNAEGGHGWWELQGDWRTVNRQRFPADIPALADSVHARGKRFGLWCEIEAAGIHATLRKERPDIMAERDGGSLAYVCLGCEAGREWAYGILDDLIVRCHADWLKIDFNLDPGAGCNRTDHGHQAGDGLYEHYLGLYGLFDRIRREHPDVVLETCSSGGLRIDLGILRHTHVLFLSDPDYSVHSLQVTWGALTILPSRVMLKFSWSQNKIGANNLLEEPITADMPLYRFDAMVRVAMLGQFGCSYRLPDLPDIVAARLAELASFHRATLAHIVCDADAYRLTGQPLRTGDGDRWTAIEYLLPGGREGAVAIFRLPGAQPQRTVRLQGLDPQARYTVRFVDGWADGKQSPGRSMVESGDDLMQMGLTLSGMPDDSSEIVLFAQQKSGEAPGSLYEALGQVGVSL